jgi:hypothetical protein
MSPARATSTLAKFFPVEAYPVAAPVLVAAGLFSYMVTRTFVADVDTKHNLNMPLDCPKARSYGELYRNTIRGFFDSRIKSGNITIFTHPQAMKPMYPVQQ